MVKLARPPRSARSALLVRLVQAKPAGEGGGLHAVVHAKLGEDVGHMHADRLAADEQLLSDLTVGAALHQQM
jgi:hypothetical protein